MMRFFRMLRHRQVAHVAAALDHDQFAIPKLLTIEQESSEERREFVVRVQREYVRNVLVGADNDNRALLTVDAAQLEDVGTALEVGAVGLLVVDKPEAVPCAEAESTATLRP